ncbi:MAG TPA: hypothetical protein VM618_05685, partial [Acidimicrobiia bacterium]|nr:hypothetical protein [Acidimicrobiia bacterium]
TGATLEHAARALRSVGYESVIAVTIARTALKRPAHLPEISPVTSRHSTTPGPVISSSVRPDVVRRITAQLAAGTYQAPIDGLVDRLVDAHLLPRTPRRA